MSSLTFPSGLFNPLNLFGDFETVTPSREELIQRWRQNFDPAHGAKSQAPRELSLDVMLTAEQATEGGALPMEFPIARLCERCDGTGSTGFYACDQCDGHGMEWRTARLDVLLPSPVRDGTVISTSLDRLGVRNLFLSVHLHVAAEA
jgi:DnaJ-class molecular chaperone